MKPCAVYERDLWCGEAFHSALSLMCANIVSHKSRRHSHSKATEPSRALVSRGMAERQAKSLLIPFAVPRKYNKKKINPDCLLINAFNSSSVLRGED
jgi:hypothetical protein